MFCLILTWMAAIWLLWQGAKVVFKPSTEAQKKIFKERCKKPQSYYQNEWWWADEQQTNKK